MTRMGRIAAFALMGAMLGCGSKGGADFVPVSGVVTLDGKPFPNAGVMFSPKGGGKDGRGGLASYGKADDSGRFTLKTQRDDEGAMPGSYLVEVIAPAGQAALPSNQQAVEIPPEGTDAANIDVKSK
jgi:hypothetical protein